MGVVVLKVFDVFCDFLNVFLRPGSPVHCIYGVSSPPDPGQNPGPK